MFGKTTASSRGTNRRVVIVSGSISTYRL